MRVQESEDFFFYLVNSKGTELGMKFEWGLEDNIQKWAFIITDNH